MRSWPTDIHGDPAQEDPDWELEKASELLRSCHVLDPWLFLVIVRVVSFYSVLSPSLRSEEIEVIHIFETNMFMFLPLSPLILASAVTFWLG